MASAKARLTLHLSREDLEFLEHYAAIRGLTVVEMIGRYLRQLREQEAEATHSGNGSPADGISTELRKQFDRLAEEWSEATRFVSSLTDLVTHPAYQRIIGMGRAIVPLLLERVRTKPGHWFWALKSITGEDPVPGESRGNLEAMSEAWLTWGHQHGYC